MFLKIGHPPEFLFAFRVVSVSLKFVSLPCVPKKTSYRSAEAVRHRQNDFQRRPAHLAAADMNAGQMTKCGHIATRRLPVSLSD